MASQRRLAANDRQKQLRKAAVERLEATEYARGKLRAREADKAFKAPLGSSLKELLDADDEPLAYTIDGLHPTGSSTLIAAQYKVGKTTLMLNLAKSWADGDDFLGRYAFQAPDGALAIFNYELTDQQFRAYARPLGIANGQSVQVLNLRGLNFDLRSAKAMEWAADWLRERDCAGLILDPFGAAARLQNENDNSEARLWLLDCVDRLKAESGVQDLWMPAHTGRGEVENGGEHVRGASAVDDWADVRWNYTRQDQMRYLRAHGRGVDVAEFQVGYDPTDTSLYFSSESGRAANRGKGQVDQVVALCQATPGIGVNDLRKGLKGGNKAKDEAIKAAVEGGLVKVKLGPNRTHMHYVVKKKKAKGRIDIDLNNA